MTATNHSITGMVLLAAAPYPAMFPIAFLLHFVLDALPHFDAPGSKHTSKTFLFVLAADMGLAASLLLTTAILQPRNWLLIIMGGIACASPDLMWLPRWIKEIQGKSPGKLGLFAAFHSQIQRHAKPQNWPYEVIWLIVFGWLFIRAI